MFCPLLNARIFINALSGIADIVLLYKLISQSQFTVAKVLMKSGMVFNPLSSQSTLSVFPKNTEQLHGGGAGQLLLCRYPVANPAVKRSTILNKTA